MQMNAPNPILKRLDALVGEWEIRAVIGGRSLSGARSEFEWLEGGAFLRQHQHLEAEAATPTIAGRALESPFPNTAIIGLDDSDETFDMLYADARGVFRVYRMSLSDGIWKIWRDAPGFFQRFAGTFSPDGNTITASWEGSSDGSTWKHDFDLTYQKVA